MNLREALRTLLFQSSQPSEPTGADAIVVDYYERQNMVPEGYETDGILVDATRVVNEGYFQNTAVAQLTFDLGEYGNYPMTLELPEGPGDENELEDFMERLGVPVEALPKLVDDPALVFPFVRTDGEWKLDWDNLDELEVYDQ